MTGPELFPLGHVVATPGALQALEDAGEDPGTYLARHVTGDWGDVPPEDAQENAYSVPRHLRILSAYTLSTGGVIWVITEADRSSTCLLLRDEY